jgi:Helix-loop-helix DNA-binding domain
MKFFLIKMDNFQLYDKEKYQNSKRKREKRNDESKRQSRNQIEQNRRNDMKGHFDELRGLLSQSNPLDNKSSYAKILQIGKYRYDI